MGGLAKGIGSLFKAPKISTPKVEPPAPMPNESFLSKQAKRKAAREAMSSGAQSTLLSTGGREKLGA